MANLGTVFNAEEIEPATPFDVLPKGKYLAVAIASELKETKARTGEYLQLTFEIIDGEHKGRKLFSRLNIRNTSKAAEDIGQRELSALCRAVGVLQLTDSEQLHDKPVMLDVAIESAKGEYGPQNRITGYAPANGSQATAPRPAASRPAAAPQTASAQSYAAASAASAPWKRK